MNRTIVATLALLVFALFCFFCIQDHATMIEHDVLARTTSALVAQGTPVDGLTVSGRDVYLAGPAGSAIISQKTQNTARAIQGVRLVSVNMTGAAVAASSASVPTQEPAPADAKTSAETVESQRKLDTVLHNNIVEFTPGSADLTPAGRATLDQVAPLLTVNPSLLCLIKGYTDSHGDAQENMDLSDRRAAATKSYLVSKGIAAERLTATGYGDADPVASNDTYEGRRKNRRIEFLLKEKQ